MLPSPDPLVVSIMRTFSAQIAAREQMQMAALVRAWLHIEDKLEADLNALAQDMAQERAAGRVVSQAKLNRLQRYQTLLGQLREEVRQYGTLAVDSITEAQLTLAGLGLDHAQQAINAASIGVTPTFDHLPVSAVHNMVGLAGDGSPLKTLLAQAYPDAVQGITTALIRGTALGWHPTKTARAMRDGSEMGLQRSLTIARTEQLRAYRTASQMQYQSSGIVSKWRRQAAFQVRTCAGCLAAHGRIYKVDHIFDAHPNCRCTLIPLVDGVNLPAGQSAEDWLREQPADVQTTILGKGGQALWASGKIPLDRFAKTVHDDTWGGAIVPRPLGELAAMEMAA